MFVRNREAVLEVLPVRCLKPGWSESGGGLGVPDGDIPVPKEGAGTGVDVGWVGVVPSVIVVTDLGKAVHIK